jgi:uncharacterized protein (TIGR04255 family)
VANTRHLTRAPLTEALLDFRVQPRDGTLIEDLLRIELKLSADYPIRKAKNQNRFEVKFEQKDGAAQGTTEVSATTIGYAFQSKDQQRIVQMARDGFTLNFLPPYSDGDTLMAEARAIWAKYVEVMQPIKITRVALRYINQIRLPLNMKDFGDYLTASPQIPAGLPQELSNFFSRVVIVNTKIGAQAGVAQAVPGEADERGLAYTLDIDAFFDGDFDVEDGAVWSKVAELRKFKNDIFFEYLTDKLLEKYE